MFVGWSSCDSTRLIITKNPKDGVYTHTVISIYPITGVLNSIPHLQNLTQILHGIPTAILMYHNRKWGLCIVLHTHFSRHILKFAVLRNQELLVKYFAHHSQSSDINVLFVFALMLCIHYSSFQMYKNTSKNSKEQSFIQLYA